MCTRAQGSARPVTPRRLEGKCVAEPPCSAKPKHGRSGAARAARAQTSGGPVIDAPTRHTMRLHGTLVTAAGQGDWVAPARWHWRPKAPRSGRPTVDAALLERYAGVANDPDRPPRRPRPSLIGADCFARCAARSTVGPTAPASCTAARFSTPTPTGRGLRPQRHGDDAHDPGVPAGDARPRRRRPPPSSTWPPWPRR